MARPTAPRVRTHTATLVLVLVGLLSLCMVGACTAPGAEPSDQEAENPSRSSQTLGNADVTGPTGAAIADAVGAFLAQDSTRGYEPCGWRSGSTTKWSWPIRLAAWTTPRTWPR